MIYLDVDGCILRHPPHESKAWWLANPGGGPAAGVCDFLEWATTHCDVRWLTAWAACGEMGDDGRAVLARRLRIPVELLASIRNPLSWDFGIRDSDGGKCAGINWEEHAAGVPWVWLDDELLDREMDFLKGRHALDHYVKVDSSADPLALRKAWAAIAETFSLSAVAGSNTEPGNISQSEPNG